MDISDTKSCLLDNQKRCPCLFLDAVWTPFSYHFTTWVMHFGNVQSLGKLSRKEINLTTKKLSKLFFFLLQKRKLYLCFSVIIIYILLQYSYRNWYCFFGVLIVGLCPDFSNCNFAKERIVKLIFRLS